MALSRAQRMQSGTVLRVLVSVVFLFEAAGLRSGHTWLRSGLVVVALGGFALAIRSWRASNRL
jgi:hypothetical protein